MKKLLLLLFVFTISQTVFSQKISHAFAGEMIFGSSNAEYTADGSGAQSNNTAGQIQDALRFTIWFHVGYYTHIDFNKNFGIYTGLVNRNVGFITKEMPSEAGLSDKVKWKRRAYTLGVPLAIKFGNLEKGMYIFVGAQYDMLYHYKEKEFLPSGKRKYTEWFSDRVNLFLPSVFGGITFPGGLSVKFTYELGDMMNKDFKLNTNTAEIKPYENLNSRMFYTSVYSMMTWSSTYTEITKEEKKLMAEY